MKGLAEQLSVSLDLSLPIPMQPEENIESESKELAISEEMLQETMKNTFTPEKTMTIFFPDMGAAVLARRDWKFGTAFPDVPPCVYTANMQNDGLKPTDKLAVVFCPKYSETEAVKRIMDMCDEAAIPCLLVNPDLINMDQGYGVRKLFVSDYVHFSSSFAIPSQELEIFERLSWAHSQQHTSYKH